MFAILRDKDNEICNEVLNSGSQVRDGKKFKKKQLIILLNQKHIKLNFCFKFKLI